MVMALAISLTSLAGEPVSDEVRTRATAATVKVDNAADSLFGSGVMIATVKPFGYVLTAQHVVPSSKRVTLTMSQGKKIVAEVLERSSEKDLALLRLPLVEGLPAPLKIAGSSAKPRSAFSVGWDKGDAPRLLEETLKAKIRLRKPGERAAVLCWEIERKPAAGRSGGPLVDEDGRVLGVASGHDGTTGYYVHSEEIHAFLKLNDLDWLSGEERR